ncbi:MAG: hypothetical protein ACKOFJ_05090, partial [Actinomycetota bacterium]
MIASDPFIAVITIPNAMIKPSVWAMGRSETNLKLWFRGPSNNVATIIATNVGIKKNETNR